MINTSSFVRGRDQSTHLLPTSCHFQTLWARRSSSDEVSRSQTRTMSWYKPLFFKKLPNSRYFTIITQNGLIYSLEITPHHFLLLVLKITLLFSAPMIWTLLGTTYMWNHTVFVILFCFGDWIISIIIIISRFYFSDLYQNLPFLTY